MSTEGSSHLPNSWALEGAVSQEAQRDWYEVMFSACDRRDRRDRRDWVGGWVLWDWKARLHPPDLAGEDGEYALYGKLAERVVATRYTR